MNDKVFGELAFQYGWRRKEVFNIWGSESEVTLVVSGSEGKEILETQRDAYKNYLANKDKIVQEIEKAIYEFYLSVVDEYRDMLEDEADELAPYVESSLDMKPLVTPIEIVILKMKDTQEIGFIFECTWDIDAGLAVRIEDGEIVEVGDQTIAL
ncbi:DUF6985 domain-containing protein [Anaeromicropila populeti]|uniref:DUF6985 domain-containing protein n=1 Tax=Anaeromicropila populeti TaxID=37658 RepID=A0A1I6K0C2_9FIRM|nr:hypothetical protein [Anaeromicropila populeti]SFR84673.1 hypothetical protein SAMN05661086_02149 [Anaeromicropila populeti]